jgi:hypothetical protein
MFLCQAKLGVFAAIGALLLSPPALAHKRKLPAPAKSASADAAAYWEARAVGYFRKLAITHGKLVALESAKRSPSPLVRHNESDALIPSCYRRGSDNRWRDQCRACGDFAPKRIPSFSRQ